MTGLPLVRKEANSQPASRTSCCRHSNGGIRQLSTDLLSCGAGAFQVMIRRVICPTYCACICACVSRTSRRSAVFIALVTIHRGIPSQVSSRLKLGYASEYLQSRCFEFSGLSIPFFFSPVPPSLPLSLSFFFSGSLVTLSSLFRRFLLVFSLSLRPSVFPSSLFRLTRKRV